MSLIQLPFELQVLILQYVTLENHLELAPLAQTCKYYASLVTDRYNWCNTVTISEPTDSHSSSINYLTNALKKKSNNYSTTMLQAIANEETAPLVLTLLRTQQLNHLEDLNIAISSEFHTRLYQTLTYHPLGNLQNLAIHDLTDDGYIISHKQDHMLLFKFLSRTLSKSQFSLKTLDISSFPSNVLIQFNDYQFPCVTSLTIALNDDLSQKEESHFLEFWRRLKHMFPNLIDLRLNLPIDNLLLFKSLLTYLPLFPWIKRLSVQSLESPKSYLSREELRTSLLQLNGLSRITAGWDMIALN